MEKKLKTVKIIAVVILIAVISMIAFGGIFLKQNNVWKNILPAYHLGMELEGIRQLRYVLDTSEEEKEVYVDEQGNIVGEVKKEEDATADTSVSLENTSEDEQTDDSKKVEYATETRTIKANPDEVKTIENFEKTKKIIQKRLERQKVNEYDIRLDTITGEMILEVANNDEQVSLAEGAVSTIGKLEIIDDQTGVILITEDDMTDVQAGVYQNNGYQVCLQITLNEEGKEKLKNISNQYRKVTNDAGEETTYYITVTLDGQTIIKTYFDSEMTNGVLQIPIGQASTDINEANRLLASVNTTAQMIKDETMPIVYTLNSDNYIKSTITQDMIQKVIIIFAITILIVTVIFSIRYKKNGFLAAILTIGYIALLTLVIRYTALYITFNSIIALIGLVILNFVWMKMLLASYQQTENKKSAFWDTMKQYYLRIIPVCVIAVIFTFISNMVISSIGMMLFWGLMLQIIYNLITIRALDIF